jgi:vanillate O-demethylase monooxygenase subunit
MNWLKNAWCVAAWDNELKPGVLFHRTLLDQTVLMFREPDGSARAMLDRCPHRFAPLHRGRLEGGVVHCAYHGLGFNGAGECVHNPHGTGAIPRAARVLGFPLVERHSLLWIWMGDAQLADPTLIPDFSFQDPETFYVGKRYLRAAANYLLEVDNIMDLSHIQFLHPTTLGSGSISKGHFETAQNGDTVWSKRTTEAEIMPEYLYQAMNIPTGTAVDRWIDVRWNAPANMALFAGATPTGRPREAGAASSQAHIFTPETATTTHYWFSFAMPRAMGPFAEQIAEQQIDGLTVPFATEDLPMLEAQQANMRGEDFWSLNPVMMASDGGGVLARRVIDRRIRAEIEAAAKYAR